ncbi:MAG: divergent polysaccharide deacetylase family protein [Notoacmeibacter sp.]|nr:divergent polysaccharide deacetylase family protein [Notoacmeibacter sp.]
MTEPGHFRRDREIDRPLGQTRRERRGLSLSVSRNALIASLAVLVVGGGSAWIVLNRDTPRNVQPEVSVVPEQQTTSAPEAKPQTVASEKPANGPAIIKVNPDNAARPGDNAADSQSVIVIRDPSELTQDARTAHLPDRALIEQTEYGPLPVRGPDGRRPFDVYAGKWSGSRGARVAIVIGGLGLSQTGTQEAIRKLPGSVTLAFSPQGNSLTRWMQQARRNGHEVLMQLPLEPFDYPRVNPGHNTLITEADPARNTEFLHWALGRTTNYTGVMNYMGARFLADGKAMKPVIDELATRGLMFLDDGTSARSLAGDMAAGARMPFAAGDAVIDAEQDKAAILKRLDQLEATARARTFAIGTGSAFDLTVDTVAAWVREATKRGIEIVPVSALAADPGR